MPDVSRHLVAVLPCACDTVCVAPEGPNEAAATSSESSGVGSGGGNWMLVRSGREPPVLWVAGLSEAVSCWSGDGNMLQKTAWAVSNQQQHDIKGLRKQECEHDDKCKYLTMFSNRSHLGIV